MHGLQHEDAFYPPTGGVNVTDGELSSLREVLVVALESISSSSDADQRKRAQFDVVMARTLHNQVPIDPGEASRPEVWSFLTCVLLPDVARWRFPDTTDPARFVGGGSQYVPAALVASASSGNAAERRTLPSPRATTRGPACVDHGKAERSSERRSSSGYRKLHGRSTSTTATGSG